MLHASMPPTGSNGAAVDVRAYRPEDGPDLLKLLGSSFGAWPEGIDAAPAEFFRWKHEESPFGLSELIVAEDAGTIAGFGAYMPWQFTVGDRLIRAGRGVDFVVEPSYRRRGISMAIRAAAMHPPDMELLWSNPNAQSQPGDRKAGRKAVGRVRQFARPGSPIVAGRRRSRARGAPPEDLSILAPSVGEVLEQLPPSTVWWRERERFSTVMTRDYLRWRYGRFAEYRAVRSAPGEAEGLAIFRSRRAGRLWVLDVCELLLERDDPAGARRLLGRVVRAAPADFVTCVFADARRAARVGFLGTRRDILLTTLPLRAGVQPDPTMLSSWAISHGDLDLL